LGEKGEFLRNAERERGRPRIPRSFKHFGSAFRERQYGIRTLRSLPLDLLPRHTMRRAGLLLLLLASPTSDAFLCSPPPSRLAAARAPRPSVSTMQAGAEPGDGGRPRVVICGGGIQGAAVAYYLSLRGVASTVIERHEVACAASGKAGGFLARNWGSGPTQQLHEASFDLHVQLADDLKLQGFRKLPTLSVSAGPRRAKVVDACSWVPEWLDRDIAKASLLDDPGLVRRSMGNWDTAQTSPKELTASFLEAAARSAGLRILTGKAEGVVLRGEQVTGVVVDGRAIAADVVVVAMGPWSCMAEDWFPDLRLPMQGIQSTSVVWETAEDPDACAVFCKEDDRGCSLEVYPRSGEVGATSLGCDARSSCRQTGEQGGREDGREGKKRKKREAQGACSVGCAVIWWLQTP